MPAKSCNQADRWRDRLVAPASLSAGLRRLLLKVIDVGDERYDPMALRALVAQALDAVVWPRWDFTLPDPTAGIVARFGTQGELRSEPDMSALRRTLDGLVVELNEQLAGALILRVDALCRQLAELAGTLEACLTAALQDDLAQLRSALQEGEAAKGRMEAFLAEIATYLPR